MSDDFVLTPSQCILFLLAAGLMLSICCALWFALGWAIKQIDPMWPITCSAISIALPWSLRRVALMLSVYESYFKRFNLLSFLVAALVGFSFGFVRFALACALVTKSPLGLFSFEQYPEVLRTLTTTFIPLDAILPLLMMALAWCVFNQRVPRWAEHSYSK